MCSSLDNYFDMFAFNSSQCSSVTHRLILSILMHAGAVAVPSSKQGRKHRVIEEAVDPVLGAPSPRPVTVAAQPATVHVAVGAVVVRDGTAMCRS